MLRAVSVLKVISDFQNLFKTWDLGLERFTRMGHMAAVGVARPPQAHSDCALFCFPTEPLGTALTSLPQLSILMSFAILISLSEWFPNVMFSRMY